jgi:8-oxo-dGTP diphosphatase
MNLDYPDKLQNLRSALRPISEEQRASAAVALLLRKNDQDLQVLVVKRAEIDSDPWSGQIALPGGKRDPKDQSLTETIVRETREETNIDLHEHSRFFGTMAAQTSTPRPEMRILPFVIFLEQNPSIKLGAELQDFAWISLYGLNQHKGSVRFSFRQFPAYLIGDMIIWGLTYRILEDFTQILECLR